MLAHSGEGKDPIKGERLGHEVAVKLSPLAPTELSWLSVAGYVARNELQIPAGGPSAGDFFTSC